MSGDGPTIVARLRRAAGDEGAAAVVTPGGDWSRRELLDRAETGAAVLHEELGSALVGVCLPGGVELATAVLAAMGAGGVAPVRADLPRRRDRRAFPPDTGGRNSRQRRVTGRPGGRGPGIDLGDAAP